MLLAQPILVMSPSTGVSTNYTWQILCPHPMSKCVESYCLSLSLCCPVPPQWSDCQLFKSQFFTILLFVHATPYPDLGFRSQSNPLYVGGAMMVIMSELHKTGYGPVPVTLIQEGGDMDRPGSSEEYYNTQSRMCHLQSQIQLFACMPTSVGCVQSKLWCKQKKSSFNQTNHLWVN